MAYHLVMRGYVDVNGVVCVVCKWVVHLLRYLVAWNKLSIDALHYRYVDAWMRGYMDAKIHGMVSNGIKNHEMVLSGMVLDGHRIEWY